MPGASEIPCWLLWDAIPPAGEHELVIDNRGTVWYCPSAELQKVRDALERVLARSSARELAFLVGYQPMHGARPAVVAVRLLRDCVHSRSSLGGNGRQAAERVEETQRSRVRGATRRTSVWQGWTGEVPNRLEFCLSTHPTSARQGGRSCLCASGSLRRLTSQPTLASRSPTPYTSNGRSRPCPPSVPRRR